MCLTGHWVGGEASDCLGLQQVRGDRSGTEQRWLEIQLGRGRVL